MDALGLQLPGGKVMQSIFTSYHGRNREAIDTEDQLHKYFHRFIPLSSGDTDTDGEGSGGGLA